MTEKTAGKKTNHSLEAEKTRAGGGIAPTVESYARSLDPMPLDVEMTRVVSFFLDGTEYAFEVTEAFEVLKPGSLTTVPRTPEFIKGILSIRGEMIPVIDIKRRLGLVSQPGGDYSRSRILVAGTDSRKAGFLVDGVGGVKEFRKSSFKPGGEKNGFVKWSVSTGKGAISILDVERLLQMEVLG